MGAQKSSKESRVIAKKKVASASISLILITILMVSLFASIATTINKGDSSDEISKSELASAAMSNETIHKIVLVEKPSDTKKTFQTASKSVGEFLQDNKIIISTNDKVVPSLSETIVDDMEIQIVRSFSLEQPPQTGDLKEEDTTPELIKPTPTVPAQTPEATQTPEPTPEPTPTPAPTPTVLVETKKETVSERIKFREETKETSKLVVGESEIQTKGKEGEKQLIYSVVYHDGVEFSREMVEEKIISPAVNRIKLIGTGEKPKEKPKEEKKEGKKTKSGGPSDDEILKTVSVEATAYTHTGNRTATGTWPKVGTVAVNPKQIPYGSKLYIEGYGYATAEDTGGFRKQGRFIIDLFMESESQCRKWGRKKGVTVHILK